MSCLEISDEDRIEITELEQAMCQEATRFDLDFQESRFASDFFEFGRSGQIYSRADVIRTDAAPIQAKVPLPNLRLRALDSNTVQVTYDSEVVRGGGVEYAHRSSIWSRTSSGWALRFHQGTPFYRERAAWMIEIVDYRSEWISEFARLAARLQAGLGPLALRIDHIGSTAVPGMAAKDIIDIQVTVQDLNPAVTEAIQVLGFIKHPGIDRDHVPPGHSAREAGWEKCLFNPPAGDRVVNVHVRRAGNPNQRYALLFRDYLVAHSATADAYAELKRRLAATLVDPRAYPDVKDPAVDVIYLAAEAWAKLVGWRPAEPR